MLECTYLIGKIKKGVNKLNIQDDVKNSFGQQQP